ncbi:ErfK/YbiS/YcfS/YnhG family protein [Oceanicola sp. 22II-s10i]|uniref:L,D-transpeptidase family protein n=1 Tax=Oceanicola sp. 22II-s10i TaxID=1317116 RepID=UPI000B52092B|nr:L,D-transpeptidase family protein [Oceanicola sp. 22II-s10i]OWU86004.1 ErfK/YbiS/YcfS/YnhG family protein [Oceanicola sp. 22II-s10i]
MAFLRILVILALTLGVTACSKFKHYDGPEVTRVVVYKEQRKMYLLHNQEVLKAYDFGLGFTPVGHKQFRNDGKTPEGEYTIDRRNPNSEFHLSIGISYPNKLDREFASSQGKSPGGDIFIHGRPWKYRKGGQDWTAGCIAVTNKEIEDIYAMVRDGTPISIYP